MNRRIGVLAYHRLGKARAAWEAHYCVSSERFAAQMRFLASEGWSAVDIDEYVAWVVDGAELPDNAFLLTFDDGFRDLHENAFPILAELRWPACVFLVSDLIGQHDLWNRDQNPSGKLQRLLDLDHIEDMARHRINFQSHTRQHRNLTTLGDLELRNELDGARRQLSATLRQSIDYLAYPYGAYDERVIATCRATGYRAGFTVEPGLNRQGDNPYRIRRLEVGESDTPITVSRKLHLGA